MPGMTLYSRVMSFPVSVSGFDSTCATTCRFLTCETCCASAVNSWKWVAKSTEARVMVDRCLRMAAVPVSGRHAAYSDADDPLRDGPSETKSVVGGRAASEFVDDDQAIARRLPQDRARLEHLGHKRRDALELRVTGSDSTEHRVKDRHLCGRARDEGADLREERDTSSLADKYRLSARIRAGDDAELADVWSRVLPSA